MEALENSTHNWFPLGDVFYRKFKMAQTSELKHKISYSSCHIAVAKNGGLIAYVKKTNQFIMDVTNPIKDSIRVFYQNGVPVGGHIKFVEKSIVCFDFSHDESLYCIMHDGKIYKFDIYNFSYKYKIASLEFMDNNIISAKLFENGFICITQNGKVYVIRNIKDPDAFEFCNLKTIFEGAIPSDYLMIPADVSKSGSLELLVPHPKTGVVVYYQNGDVKHMKNAEQFGENEMSTLKGNYDNESSRMDNLGKITNIFISPKKMYIAMYSDEGTIFIFSADLDPKDRTMTKLTIKPYQIMWCAEDCIAICHQKSIFLIGPNNIMKQINFDIKSSKSESHPNLHLVQEVDGIRIITDDGCEFLQKVNEDLKNAISPLSVEPARKLIDAFRYAEEKKPNCDEEIRSIRNNLTDAVNVLLSATTLLWDKESQIYLMKAAQHGKTFLSHSEFNFNNFVQVCKDLRILNNLRDKENPRFITYEQYQTLESKELINRLIKNKNFYLAHEISLFLGLKTKTVYQKWAIAKIKNLPKMLSQNDEMEYYEEIQRKLKEISGISYIQLAKKAFQYQKEQIGIKFLENEQSILAKIPQYLEMKMWDSALDLAIETYDSNVIYTVVDKILTNETIDSFKEIVCKNKQAEPIVIEYLKTNHLELLEEYLESLGKFDYLFFLSLENYYSTSSIGLRRDYIKKCRNYLKVLSANDVKKEWDFYKNVLDEIDKSTLLKKDLIAENNLKNSDDTNFDISLYDTYKSLVKVDKAGLAETKNKSIFNVSQKSFNTIRLRGYGELNQIEAIKLLGANIKNYGINYMILLETCIDYKFFEAAAEYAKKLNDRETLEFRVKLLLSIEKDSDALEIVIANKNHDRRLDLVNDIVKNNEQLRFKVEEFCAKYKTRLN